MKESLTPDKIHRAFLDGDLDKEKASELLISLIESSEETEIRVKSIKTLEKINFQGQNLFKILENCLISDEDPTIRASVAKFIILNFLDDAIPALKWLIQHEKSPIVIKLIFNSINESQSPQLSLVEKELKIWCEKFADKIGIVPEESVFFLDLEVLFSKGKRNYEINPFFYKHFKDLSDVKKGEPWLIIKNKHVVALNFNFFNWNFIKNNTDIVNSLSKLQDLNVYLYSLRKYRYNDTALSIIPESIGSLKYLKTLILRRNNLRNLPHSFEKLTLLEELDLSYNKFEEIPQILNSLNTLKKLNIKHNLIQNIPESLSNKIKIIR